MSHLTLDILLQSQTKVTSSQFQHKIRANGEFNLILLDIRQFPSIISFWTFFDCSMFRDNQNYFSRYSFSINWSHRWQKWPKHSLDVCIHVLSFISSWMWCCWYNFPFDTSSVPLLLVSTNRGGRRGLFVSPLHRKPDEKSSRDEMVCLELEPACTNIWDKMKRDETWRL